ncbi:SDR family NAD(P)-dependent oxidoreductase [Gloeobacter kilaueensis]|uniref:Short-chain dehydrogenase/reductase SDR n=1 Tax=Gloeobacter kilaueensis (strain ATCC BAA-2537 / CCAP 1431/1 / ULC 316 / JS1) TaxID=1183438 RepID=U5QM15_GLOK1|nr:SDR family NAD(P)-dependent oxidoreductase [Gloeobacter kilaueensis]AGY59908.1 short-chain dehydrogenase/reductase SDR [Gloeobacter kilaueensis JS1]
MNNPAIRPLAVVTGASSGIGFELAKQFAQHDFDLLVTAKGSDIDQAAQAFRGLGAAVQTVQANLADYDGVEALYKAIKAAGRPVEAIAINAGVGVGGEFARETDLKDELNLINLNVVSTVHLAKRIVKDMLERHQGRILFTSSIAALMPGPYEAVYSASKAFIQSFAKALRNELKDTGVSVTALLPGATETNFFHRAEMDDTKVGSDKKDDPADVAQEGFEALMAGKEEVIAGSLKTKLQANLTKVLPDSVNAEQHRQMSEPGSQAKK